MTMPTRKIDPSNARIRDLKEREGLSRSEIAAICRVTTGCVDFWFASPDSKMYRRASDSSVALLEFELGKRFPAWTKPMRKAALLKKAS